jgi:tRNA threonylcarbamoyladenosine dehydratase
MTQANAPAVDEVDLYLQRTGALLGSDAVRTLRGATVAIPGCGGVGGATAVLLARTGIGGFILADPGEFDPPDMNRQWGATVSTLGQNKARVYERLLRDINPSVRIRTYPQGITDDNVDDFLDGADVVVDGLDFAVPLPLRLRLYANARKRGLYCLSSPIIGMATVMMCAAPDGMPLDAPIDALVARLKRTARLPDGFRSHLLPDHVEALERGVAAGTIPSIGIAPAFSAGFVSSEVALILLRRQFPHWRAPIALPDVLVIEAIRPNCRVVDFDELFSPATPSTASPAQPGLAGEA